VASDTLTTELLFHADGILFRLLSCIENTHNLITLIVVSYVLIVVLRYGGVRELSNAPKDNDYLSLLTTEMEI
jgi:hypothetical protein